MKRAPIVVAAVVALLVVLAAIAPSLLAPKDAVPDVWFSDPDSGHVAASVKSAVSVKQRESRALERHEDRLTLHFRVLMEDTGAEKAVTGCGITLDCYALDGASTDERVMDRVLGKSNGNGEAHLQLPKDASHVLFRATYADAFTASGAWSAGQPTRLTVRLKPSSSVRVSVHGNVPLEGYVDLLGREVGQRARARFVGASTVVQGVPVAWSPVSVILRTAEGVEYTAENRVPLSRGETSEVQIDVSRILGSVRGVVVDERGAPIDNASVLVYPANPCGFQQSEMSTSADGVFAFSGIPAVPLLVSISPPGYVRRQERIDLTSGPNADMGEIVVTDGAAVTGEVALSERGIWSVAGVLPITRFGEWGLNRFPVSGQSVHIGSDGRFEIPHLSDGKHLVWIANGHSVRDASWCGVIADIAHANDVDVGLLDWSAERDWTGRLISLSGHPWPENSRCFAMGLEQPWWSSAAIERSGRCKLRVGQGSWMLGYVSDRRWRWLRTVSAAESVCDVEVPTGSVSFVSYTDIPSDVRVQLESVGSGAGSSLPRHHSALGREGMVERSCTLESLSPGDYRLRAYKGRIEFAPITFSLREGEALLLPWPIDWY